MHLFPWRQPTILALLLTSDPFSQTTLHGPDQAPPLFSFLASAPNCLQNDPGTLVPDLSQGHPSSLGQPRLPGPSSSRPLISDKSVWVFICLLGHHRVNRGSPDLSQAMPAPFHHSTPHQPCSPQLPSPRPPVLMLYDFSSHTHRTGGGSSLRPCSGALPSTSNDPAGPIRGQSPSTRPSGHVTRPTPLPRYQHT